MVTERRAFAPCARLDGGPRIGTILSEVQLTTENLAGYRLTGLHAQHTVTGPRGGEKVYSLKVWRYAGA